MYTYVKQYLIAKYTKTYLIIRRYDCPFCPIGCKTTNWTSVLHLLTTLLLKISVYLCRRNYVKSNSTINCEAIQNITSKKAAKNTLNASQR